jgi:hypothetical protein
MDAQEQHDSPADEPEGEAAEVDNAAAADDAFSDDPAYRAAVIDLLGALAYGELTAFSRLAADAEMAPSQPEKAALARVAVAEFHHYEALTERLREMGADADAAMEPFIAPIDGFHDRTRPTGWLEGLVKAYVGDGIATAEFAVKAVREAIEADPRIAGRLALWGRRLVGEALSQSQRVAAERDALASLLVGGINRPGADLAEMGRMFARLTDEHIRRMGQLGLSA